VVAVGAATLALPPVTLLAAAAAFWMTTLGGAALAALAEAPCLGCDERDALAPEPEPWVAAPAPLAAAVPAPATPPLTVIDGAAARPWWGCWSCCDR
jgi:hypothetical protein